jgi:hypothetical protein
MAMSDAGRIAVDMRTHSLTVACATQRPVSHRSARRANSLSSERMQTVIEGTPRLAVMQQCSSLPERPGTAVLLSRGQESGG